MQYIHFGNGTHWWVARNYIPLTILPPPTCIRYPPTTPLHRTRLPHPSTAPALPNSLVARSASFAKSLANRMAAMPTLPLRRRVAVKDPPEIRNNPTTRGSKSSMSQLEKDQPKAKPTPDWKTNSTTPTRLVWL